MANIFKGGFKRADLLFVLEEIGVTVVEGSTSAKLKDLILASDEFKKDPEFVKLLFETTVKERKKQEELELQEKKLDRDLQEKKLDMELQEKKLDMELQEKRLQEKDKMELQAKKLDMELEMEKAKMAHELEMAKVQAQVRETTNPDTFSQSSVAAETVNSRRKFTLPKLQFRQFGDDIKEWLPFWSQFQHIDDDNDIALEDKFQYLIQATVIGSRAREIVESFPPTGDNYVKAVDSLRSRFGNEDLLVEVYVRELLKLIINVQMDRAFPLTSLYDKLETYLRALDTLGVTTDKCASVLYPMVESCFPEEFLKAYHRSTASTPKLEAKERLSKLMVFLKSEVEGEARINLAMDGFGLLKVDDTKVTKKKKIGYEISKNGTPATAAVLHTVSHVKEQRKGCIFCDGKHNSADCFSAQKMSLTEKQEILKNKRGCFACLVPGHVSKRCRSFVKCLICGRKHMTIMCDNLEKCIKAVPKEQTPSLEKEVNMTSLSRTPKVFLQTLVAKLGANGQEMNVRLLIDSASQRSYIMNDVAKSMMCTPLEEMKVAHSLFGGVTTEVRKHKKYEIRVSSLKGKFSCKLEALGQDVICEKILPVNRGPWLKELKGLRIYLTDVSHSHEQVHVLIGADMIGQLLTGQQRILSNGMVATETHLGWTLMGKVPQQQASEQSLSMSVMSLFIQDFEMVDLWRLDLLGIKDPIEKKSKQEIDFQTREHFLETVTVNNEGRYEVCLPWADDKSPLPDNVNLAKKRLEYTTSKLLSMNLYQEYENVFSGWLDEGIIEEVAVTEVGNYGNYLPHRPVIKPSSTTTPIRPVFDASAKLQNHPSLNQCLQCGPNLIELLPDLLLRFREGKYGVTADIRKAFCQISIRQEDRDFLRFLWWENLGERKLKVFRHARVVFGVNCSPFLLASVIEYHIGKTEEYEKSFREKLAKSFYVDNVVTSVNDEEELERFMDDSKKLMSKGGFDLRAWEFSGKYDEDNKREETHVLGLVWNKSVDTLKIDMSWVNDFNIEKVTKRNILSSVHKVFDPFGFVSPVMLRPKIMLQKTWKIRIGWDEEVGLELRREYLQWFQELKLLRDIEIPRCIQIIGQNPSNCAIHTFVDGSQDAYAAVTFLRIEKEDEIEVFLLAAKSRVSPLRGVTIPRMELLAAVIGSRLANSIVEAAQWFNIRRYFWSDSTTVLAWILRDANWSVFVRNRVQEIKKLSDPSSWRHVPGEMNPADLPSRGCKAKHLVSSRWWEGPQWMKEPEEFGRLMNSSNFNWIEEEIKHEEAKTSCTLLTKEVDRNNNWYFERFSSYDRIVRLVAWVFRFKHNCRNRKDKKTGELNAAEYHDAEIVIVRMIQEESFTSEDDVRLKTLHVFKDEQGIIRLKTKITYRKDEEDFLRPAVLPSNHEVVKRLIRYTHEKNCHAGIQILLNLLREKYWILHGRKTVRQVLSNCVICKRFNSKNIEAVAPPLPEDRVKDAAVFQITGIDMAGPLFLQGNGKSWVMIFTCAVYRAVHLELVMSASTDAFLMAFRRFVARRGRCSTVYCDNGTNFVGAANSLKKLDWDRVQKYGAVNATEWKLNPPTAAWWGGWWERLIRILKDLLKRVLGRASLDYEEMTTVLADCESIMNSRPLSYITEDEAIKPISPSMFLQDIQEYHLPDVDDIDRKSLTRRIKYRQTILKNLRNRFRSEYLGTLIQRRNRKEPSATVAVGDIVLVGADNKKRINWPLGRISQLIPGRDGKVRLVKVQTSHQELLRPIQRIYPLEISSSDCHSAAISGAMVKRAKSSTVQRDISPNNKPKFSYSGRMLKVPERLGL